MKKIIILLIVLYTMPSFSQTMEWHIKAAYAEIEYLGNDIFKVKGNNGKWGIINKRGETTIKVEYDSITSFTDNRALLLDATGQSLLGIVNEEGKLLKSFNNSKIKLSNYPRYKEGWLVYEENGMYGYLGKDGKKCGKKYKWAAPFNNGVAVVQYLDKQGKGKSYGLVNTNNERVFIDNRNILFMSTPVNNELLVVTKKLSGKIEITIERLEPNGNKLREVKSLVKKVGRCSIGNNHKRLSMEGEFIFEFDDLMRLTYSSRSGKFNDPFEESEVLQEKSPFSKDEKYEGWAIIYNRQALVTHPLFEHAVFCGNEYAIVSMGENKKGVLKLNKNGYMSIDATPAQCEFYHNKAANGDIVININGLQPKSQVQVGIKGLNAEGEEEKYTIPAGFSGKHKQKITYFIPADQENVQVELPLDISLYIDGMLCKTKKCTLTAVHRQGFEISEPNKKPQFSNDKGGATISFVVESLKSVPSPSAKVLVSETGQTIQFNGSEKVDIGIPVTVPTDKEKTFSFTITVTEDGCPSYTKTISKRIKHHGLY